MFSSRHIRRRRIHPAAADRRRSLNNRSCIPGPLKFGSNVSVFSFKNRNMRFSDEKYYNQYKLLGSEPVVFGSLEPEPEPLEKKPGAGARAAWKKPGARAGAGAAWKKSLELEPLKIWPAPQPEDKKHKEIVL